jgi:magnesium transporter
MKIIIHEIIDHQIITVADPSFDFPFDAQKEYWLEIKVGNRDELREPLKLLNTDNRLHNMLLDPQHSHNIMVLGETIGFNLPVSLADHSFRSEVLSVFIQQNLVVTVVSEHFMAFDELREEIESYPFQTSISLYQILYYLISAVLHHGMDHVMHAKYRVKNLSLKVDQEASAIQLNDIVQCKTDILELQSIVEAQFNVLVFTPNLDWSNDQEQLKTEFSHMVDGFKYLNNSMEKLEQKVEGVRNHYQLLLQEKTNRRLNVLTIINALFVPLTFLAGIYGMNFSVMPELNWPNGYFYVLILMVLIVVVQLYYFRKNGWFK